METVQVEVEQGWLTGERRSAALSVFFGVPYAAPPTGPGRFAPARPPLKWAGRRDATRFAASSIQPPPDPSSAVPGDPSQQSEDCLYLNIWTPACDGGARPVMVWIHGGGFVGGSPSSALYDGEKLAAEDVVIVNVGYRLGALGWLAHPALASAEGAPFGNWGLTDQLAALEWVRRNIDSFGGDPANVTVFGESAGGISVASLLACSNPKDYFDRAIIQSGAPLAHEADRAVRIAESFSAELGLDSFDPAALAEMPTEALLGAQAAMRQSLGAGSLAFQPVVDGAVLRQHPALPSARADSAGLDLLIGTNRDEWRFWLFTDRGLRELDWEGVFTRTASQVRAAGLEPAVDARELVEEYRRVRGGRGEGFGPVETYCALATDWTFRVPSMRLATEQAASGGRVSAYLFDWESPLMDGRLGACHALELPFVFGTLTHPFVAVFSGGGDRAETLSLAMRRAWTAFARSGDASSDGVGAWPGYETGSRSTKRLGSKIETVSAPMEDERALVERCLVSPRAPSPGNIAVPESTATGRSATAGT